VRYREVEISMLDFWRCDEGFQLILLVLNVVHKKERKKKLKKIEQDGCLTYIN